MIFSQRYGPFTGFLAFLLLPFMASLLDAGDGGGGGGGGDGGSGGGQGGGDGGKGAAGGGDAGGGSGKPPTLGSGGGKPAGDGGGSGDGKGGQGGDGKGVGDGSAKDPWFVGLWDKTGKIDKSRFDALPDAMKPHKELFAKYDTAEAFFHGVANLGQLAGKKGLQPLPEGAPAEIVAERNALLRQINGTPEKPEGYGITKPASMPDAHWNGEYVGGMLGILHKHNASPALVKELVAADLAAADKLRGGYDQQSATALAGEGKKLKDAFGAEYEKQLGLAQRVATTVGIDLDDPVLGNNASVIIALSKIAGMISEDKLVTGDGKGGEGMSNREKAQDIVKNPANPMHKAYHDPNDSGHEAAVQAHSNFNKAHHAQQKKK